MSVEGIFFDVGFLGVAGFGVWRGQGLFSRHLELKHEREMARLSMDRMEKSAQPFRPANEQQSCAVQLAITILRQQRFHVRRMVEELPAGPMVRHLC